MGADLTQEPNYKLIAEQLKKFPVADCPVIHRHTDREYVRETFMPKGTFAIGKKHRYKTVNILLEGHIKVHMGHGEVKDIIAPCVFISEANTSKMAYFVEDTKWINVHASDTKDLEEIEKNVIISDKEELYCMDITEEHF